VSVIGCDPSVDHPAFATWPQRGIYQLAIRAPQPRRLYELHLRVKEWAEAVAPADLEAVFIERPVGRVPSPELVRAAGVIEAALVAGLRAAYEHPPTVFRLSPGEWKKGIGLSGNADKSTVYEWAHPLTLNARRWRGEGGLNQSSGLTQDQADALAIAAAGASLLEAEPAA